MVYMYIMFIFSVSESSVLQKNEISENAIIDFKLSRLNMSPTPGGRLNKKVGLTRYVDSHVKDKTSWRPSYL